MHLTPYLILTDAVICVHLRYILGGDLELENATPGDVTWFNFWDFEMSLPQLNDLEFSAEGNVASMRTLKTAGNIHQYMINYPPNGRVTKILCVFLKRIHHFYNKMDLSDVLILIQLGCQISSFRFMAKIESYSALVSSKLSKRHCSL